MSFHSDQIANHPLHNYTYADAAERLAATGFDAGDIGKVALQEDDTTFWILRTAAPVWGDLTAAGVSGDFSAVTQYFVPVNSGSQVYVNSGAHVDLGGNGEWTFDHDINVPAGSINIGTTLRLSEGGEDLIIADLLEEQMAFSVNSDFTDATGSERPNYADFGVPISLEWQLDDSINITANPLTFQIPVTIDPPTNVQLTDRLTLRTGAIVTNFRAKVTDNATGLILRYIPSHAAWEGELPGLDLADGDNTFFFAEIGTSTPSVHYLGYVPFVSTHGQLIDVEFKADAMNILGDAFGVPYQIYEVHHGPVRELALREHADRVQSTGLLEGGLISQASATTVDWTSGRGQVVDYGDPENPIISDVTWDAVAGLTPDNLATDGITVFGYDAAGTLVQKLATAIAIEDIHEVIWFGTITHLSSTVVTIQTSPGNLGYDGIGSFEDFIALIIGPANVSGNVYGANGANLNMDVTGGNAFILGSNFRNDPSLADIVTLPSDSALTFFKVYRQPDPGLGVYFDGAATTEIDPTQYDDGSGVLQAVSGSNWTIQRIFRNRDGETVVAYGQEEFSTKSTAIDALGAEPFEEKSPLPLTLFRGSLVISKNCTDMSNLTQAEFFAQSSFRIAGAQSASSTIPGITNPGGVNTSVQFNNSNVFGGDSDFTYDTATKTLSLKPTVLGTTTLQFKDFAGDVKGFIDYDDNTDIFSIEAEAGQSELYLQSAVIIHRGAIDGRLDVEAQAASGSALLTLSAAAGGTGLSLEYDDGSDSSNITAEIGPLTLSTVEADEDITINPTGKLNVGGAINITDTAEGLQIDDTVVFFSHASDYNVLIGQDALASITTGEENIAIGIEALNANTGGTANIAIGFTAGYSNLGGSDNTAIGSEAFYSNTTGGSNTVIGRDALYANTTGDSNTVIGQGALQANIFGRRNTVIGAVAGVTMAQAASTGDNTVIGFNTAGGLVNGISNTIIGANITGLSPTLTGNIILADGDGNQRINVDELGNVGIGIANAIGKLHVYNDSGFAGSSQGLTVEQGGIGDALVQWHLSGGVRYLAGIDNSEDDLFKIEYGGFLSSAAAIQVNTDNEVGIGVTPDSKLHVYQSDNETGDQAGLTIEQGGTGDAIAQFLLTSGQRWVMGLSNAGGDAFEISSSINLGSNTRFVINTTGEVKITDSLSVGTVANPVSPLHIYEDTANTDATAGLTIEQDGVGDALAQFLLTGGQRWVMGADNSDDGKFKISASLDLDTDVRLSITNAGKVGVNIAEPVSWLHVYEDNATTGTGGGITIEQDGGGDAMLQYLLTGGQRWVTGIDNSDGDDYKIASSNDLGTDTVLKLNGVSGACLFANSPSTTNWSSIVGLDLVNEDGTDDTYTSIVNRGANNLAAGMLFKNDDYSADYGHIVFAAHDVNGIEDHALIIKPAHTEIVNSTNTPYGGRGKVQNRLTYSQELDNAEWVPGSTDAPVVTANNAIAPDGTMTADTLSFGGPGAGLIRQGTLGLIEADTYNVSGWVRHVSGGTQLTARLDTENTAPWIANDRWQRFDSDIVQGTGGPWFDLFVFSAHAPATFEVWGLQISDGAGSKPYLKTEETALLTQTQGATVNNDLYVSDSIYKEMHEVATKGPEVVEVWSLDDMPRVGGPGVGDVIPDYKLYRFMQEIDWGTTRMLLQNDAYALFEGIDVFVTSQTYSGTLPWIYGEGTIRCVGNGMTWKITSDNATMFDITAGGWGMDYSTLMTTGDNCSLGTIVAPTVSDPLLGTRFISTRSLFQGFKTGLTLVNPGALHIDISFFYDATDAVGPMLTIDGLTKAAIIEATEVTMASANSDFLFITPVVERPVNCTNITLADGQSFFAAGDTGAITLFDDASIGATAITSVTDSSGTARFNYTSGTPAVAGQKVVISGFTTNTEYNGTWIVETAGGTDWFEIKGLDWGSDETGSFLSNAVSVTSTAHGLSELDKVLITETLAYNTGSFIHHVATNTFQINAVWDTGETSGTWDDGSLIESSKYVTTLSNGTQRDSKALGSVYVSGNAALTSITGTGTYDPLNLGTSSAGSAEEEFTLMDAATGETRYDGVNTFEGTLQASVSANKTGGAVTYKFRVFKTVGSSAFDAATVTRSITTSIGSISLVMSVALDPMDQFRVEVETQGATNDITITDFSMVVQ